MKLRVIDYVGNIFKVLSLKAVCQGPLDAYLKLNTFEVSLANFFSLPRPQVEPLN